MGTTNADTVWLCTTDPAIALGSSPVVWAKIAPASGGGAMDYYTLMTTARSASLSHVTLSGEQTINGIYCYAGERVLLMGQSPSGQNGLWVVRTGAWTIAPEISSPGKMGGMLVRVRGGSSAGKSYYCINPPDGVNFSNPPVFVEWGPFVTGASGAGNNEIPRFDSAPGTAGNFVQTSGCTISAGNLYLSGNTIGFATGGVGGAVAGSLAVGTSPFDLSSRYFVFANAATGTELSGRAHVGCGLMVAYNVRTRDPNGPDPTANVSGQVETGTLTALTNIAHPAGIGTASIFGDVIQAEKFQIRGVGPGVNGSFTAGGITVTVRGGIITGIS